MTRHKHADIIHAWAEGAEVEYWSDYYKAWCSYNPLSFSPDTKYRIKPKEPEWWEDIPEHGILVKRIGDPDVRGIVYSQTFEGKPNLYELWEPLTNEEIERLKR